MPMVRACRQKGYHSIASTRDVAIEQQSEGPPTLDQTGEIRAALESDNTRFDPDEETEKAILAQATYIEGQLRRPPARRDPAAVYPSELDERMPGGGLQSVLCWLFDHRPLRTTPMRSSVTLDQVGTADWCPRCHRILDHEWHDDSKPTLSAQYLADRVIIERDKETASADD
jgi:hypothetical protein